MLCTSHEDDAVSTYASLAAAKQLRQLQLLGSYANGSLLPAPHLLTLETIAEELSYKLGAFGRVNLLVMRQLPDAPERARGSMRS